MAKREISTRFTLEGEQKYKSAMTEAANAIKVLNSEQKLAKAQYESTGDAQQYAADQARILKEQIEQQKKAVAAAEKAIKELTENGVDKNSKQMQQWRTKLNNARTSLTQMQSRLDKVGTELGEEETAFGKTESAGQSFQNQMEEVAKGIDFQNTISAIDNITGHIEKVVKAAAKAAKAVWEMGVDAGAWADNIATAANEIGVDPETYQSWQYASRFIDTSVDDIVKNWKDIDNKLISSGETRDTFLADMAKRRIRVMDAQTKQMRSGSDIFWDAIDYLHNLGDETTRTAEATKIFGNDWRKLNPLITAGSKAYKEMAEEGRSVAVVSNENVALLGGVDDSVQDLEARLDKLKYDALAELAPTFQKVAESMSTAVTALDEFVQSEEGQAALSGLSDALSGIIDSFLGDDNGKGTFEGIVNAAKDAVVAFTDAMSWISEHGEAVKGIIAGLAGAWASLEATKSILEFMQLLKVTPLNKLTTLFNGLSGAGAGAGAEAGAETVLSSGGAALPSLGGPAVMLSAATGFYLKSARKMADDNKEMKDAVVEASEQVVAAAAETRGDVEKNLGQETADLRDGLIQHATEALRLVEDRSSQAAPGIGMYVPTLGINRSALTEEVNWLKEHMGELESLLSGEMLERIRNANPNGGFLGIGSMGDQQLWDLVNDVINEIARQTGDAADQAKEDGKSIPDGMVEGINENAADVADATSTMAENAIDAAEATLDSHSPSRVFEAIGGNAAVGMANGIYDRGDEAIRAAQWLADSVTNIVQSALDIHSPSKVFEKLGEFTGMGFAEGIELSARRVNDAVNKMVNATAYKPAVTYSGFTLSSAQAAAVKRGDAAPSAANPDMVHVTLVMDEEVVGDIMAPIINDKIGANIQATRR